MFRTILVCVDLAEMELAKTAVTNAVGLAQQSGGAVRLVNVQPLLPATYMDYVPAEFDDEQREEADSKLKLLASQVPLPAERVSYVVRSGGIYPEILGEADAWGADLIVIGSHRPAMATYLMGSNAKTVVRHAKCSVLVIRD
jgi:nucleotide-binding universal stress UspA family protein